MLNLNCAVKAMRKNNYQRAVYGGCGADEH